MKAFLLLTLSVILIIQTTSAYPQQRYRREAYKHVELSPEGEKKREELQDYVVTEMVGVVKRAIDSHKELFEKIVKDANESSLKTDALKEHLQKFTDIINKANSLPAELENEEDALKLFEIFGECTELLDGYDTENPTEEEKLIKSISEENGALTQIFQFIGDFRTLRKNYRTHIQQYVDSLSEDDKVKEAKFLEWFEKFKTNRSFDTNVDTTIEIFDFFDDDESEEKNE